MFSNLPKLEMKKKMICCAVSWIDGKFIQVYECVCVCLCVNVLCVCVCYPKVEREKCVGASVCKSAIILLEQPLASNRVELN